MATTRAEFIERLKKRSKILKALDPDMLDIFVDDALRAFSERLPKVVVLKNQTVPDSKEITFPIDALNVFDVVETEGKKQVIFRIEDDETDKNIVLGSRKTSSPEAEGLITQSWYVDPELQSDPDFSNTALTAVDIRYAKLHTIASLSDTSLDIIRYHVEMSAYLDKLEQAEENFVDLVDTEPSGATTTIRRSQAGAIYSKMAESKKNEFDKRTQRAYGTRG